MAIAYRGGNLDATIRLANNARLLSDGGDILIRGEGGNEGIRALDQLLIDAGTGIITLEGKSSASIGINLGNNNPNIAITSASTQCRQLILKDQLQFLIGQSTLTMHLEVVIS
jgi:hypothetical protein